MYVDGVFRTTIIAKSLSNGVSLAGQYFLVTIMANDAIKFA